MISNLVQGHDYSKAELEKICEVKFGYQINGIVVRKEVKGSPKRLILLFQRSEGPYPDLVTQGKIRYVGAGLRGDQSLSGVNRVLSERGPIDGVFFFHQPPGSNRWTYMGFGAASFIGEDERAGRKLLFYDIDLAHRPLAGP